MSRRSRFKVDFFNIHESWTTKHPGLIHKTKNPKQATIKWEKEARGKRGMEDVSEWLLRKAGLIFVSFWGHPTVPVRYYGVDYDDDCWELLLATVAYDQDPLLKKAHESWAKDLSLPKGYRTRMSAALRMVYPGQTYTIPKVCFSGGSKPMSMGWHCVTDF